MTPQGIASTVRRLEEAGWIDRRPHAVHGRIVLLALTEKGRRVLQDAIAIAEQLEASVTQDISTSHPSPSEALDQMQARIVPRQAAELTAHERKAMSTPTATHDSATTDGLGDSVYRYERILVAIDASRESHLALARAVDIARRANARLDLLDLFGRAVDHVLGRRDAADGDQRALLRRVLREAAASVEGVPVTTYLAARQRRGSHPRARREAPLRPHRHGEPRASRAVAALLGSTSLTPSCMRHRFRC